MSGGIDDDVREVAIGQLAQIFLQIVRQLDRVLDTHDFPAEIEALLVHVQDEGPGAAELDEFESCQANGTGADNEA